MKRFTVAILICVGIHASAVRAGDPVGDMAFDDQVHDFGNVVQGTELTHSFKVTNPYKFPLNITRVRPLSSCVQATATQTSLQPGETAYIDVRMDTQRFVGPKSVTTLVLIAGNGGVSEVRLLVSANSQVK
jgi:LEA14-like dessication related protein